MEHEAGEAKRTSLWRNPNYLLLQSGQLISFIGNQQQFIALPLFILALTGSAVQAGIAAGLSTIADLVVSPFAGILVDRWDRKKTMLLCDTGRMLLLSTLPLAFWLNRLSMLQIYLVVTFASVFGTLFTVANTATLPNIVSARQVPEALAQSQAAYSFMRAFGSLLGGTLYSLGKALPFLVNAISFGVSVLSLGLMRGTFQKSQRQRVRQPMHQALNEGVSWLWRQPLIRFLTIVNGADSLRYGAGYLVIVVIAQNLHTSPGGIGAIFTGAASGAILGNLVSSRVRRRVSFGKIALSMLWLEALMFPLYAFAPGALAMCFIAAAEEFVSPMYTLSFASYQLTATPDEMRGRVSSLVQMVTQGAGALGAILSGFLIQSIGAQNSALLLGAWLIGLATITTLNKRVRHASSLE